MVDQFLEMDEVRWEGIEMIVFSKFSKVIRNSGRFKRKSSMCLKSIRNLEDLRNFQKESWFTNDILYRIA